MQIQILEQPREERPWQWRLGRGFEAVRAGPPSSPAGQMLAALPGKPGPHLLGTLPVSFQFTNASMERWVHTGRLDVKIFLSSSPEVGGPKGPSVWSLYWLIWARGLSLQGNQWGCGCDYSLFALGKAVGRLPTLIADSSSLTGRGLR